MNSAMLPVALVLIFAFQFGASSMRGQTNWPVSVKDSNWILVRDFGDKAVVGELAPARGAFVGLRLVSWATRCSPKAWICSG